MTSFRLQLREPYRSVLPNNTCNNLPLGGGVSQRMIILTKQLVAAKSISLCWIIQESLKTVGIIHYLSFFAVSSIYSIFQTNLDPEDSNVSVETKPFISLYCLRAVKLRNLIELILLISA